MFDQIGDDPQVAKQVSHARLIIRLRMTDPPAEVLINGRKDLPQIFYGSTTLRPDLDIELPAEIFHRIMLAELPLGRALASGQMKVRGPIWKSFVLQEIFQSGQREYPQVLKSIDHKSQTRAD